MCFFFSTWTFGSTEPSNVMVNLLFHYQFKRTTAENKKNCGWMDYFWGRAKDSMCWDAVIICPPQPIPDSPHSFPHKSICSVSQIKSVQETGETDVLKFSVSSTTLASNQSFVVWSSHPIKSLEKQVFKNIWQETKASNFDCVSSLQPAFKFIQCPLLFLFTQQFYTAFSLTLWVTQTVSAVFQVYNKYLYLTIRLLRSTLRSWRRTPVPLRWKARAWTPPHALLRTQK